VVILSPFPLPITFPTTLGQTSLVSSFPLQDRWEGTPSLERVGKTYDWRAATLFVFVLIATCTMACQRLTPGLASSQQHCMQPHFTPTSSPPIPLHLVAISILAINLPVPGAHLGLSQPSLRTARPSTPPHALARYTKEPWLYPPLPLTKERSFAGRA